MRNMENQLINQLVGSGMAGAMLMVIIIPMFNYLKTKIDEKDLYINKLIEDYFAGASKSRSELHLSIIKLQETTQDMPIKILNHLDKILNHLDKKYPAEQFNKMYKKIVKK